MIMAQDSLVAPLISRFIGLKPECKFVVIKFPSLKTIVLKCLSYVSFKLIICNRFHTFVLRFLFHEIFDR
ncbi:unnamed protein product [Tenebrio molitor]|nr:unnamed protein product [Tenebrio molitor]